MQSYQPTLELALDYCQSKDCTKITLTDVSPTFLDYGINWLKIQSIVIEVYDQSGNLLGSKDCQFYTQLAGSLSLSDSYEVVTGTDTTFETDLMIGDYIVFTNLENFYCKVGTIDSDVLLKLTTNGIGGYGDVNYGRLNLEYELGAEYFGGSIGDSIPDGIYDIKYIIKYSYTWDNDGTPTNVTNEETFLEETQTIYCNILCCVAKKLADIATDFIKDPCEFSSSDEASDAMLAWAWLESLPYLEECGDVDRLQETLDALIDYCGSSNCQNCGK